MSGTQSVLGLVGSPNKAGRTNELVSAALEGARSEGLNLNQYIPIRRKEDFAAMLESLHELLQERGDKVTATLIAERMEKKLQRHVHYRLASHLYILLGFETKKGQRLADNGKYYVVPNPELLAEKRAQFCGVEISNSYKRKGLAGNNTKPTD